MKTLRRSVSILLSLIMLFGVLAVTPVTASAEEEPDTSFQSKVTVSGSNSVGSLIADAVNEEQQTEESGNNLENNITDVTVDGASATVEFSNSETCKIVVGIFDEDGKAMLGSGIAEDLMKDSEKTTVDLSLSPMPEYFYIKAFILDDENHPLGSSYESNYYTRAFQDFLSKTTDDFDSDLVYNFDSDKKNNFAVFEKDTKDVEVNSYTVSGDTYTFTNINSEISALKEGDIFTFTDKNGELVVIKVKTISVDGTSAVITESDDLGLDDVFSYVKIDTEGVGDEATIDMSEADEGVTIDSYDTSKNNKDKYPTGYSNSHSSGGNVKLPFIIERGVVSGGVEFTLGLNIKVYIDDNVGNDEPFFEVSLNFEALAKSFIKIEGKLDLLRIKGGYIAIPTTVPGVYIGAELDFVVKTSASLETELTVTQEFGFGYNSVSGFKNLSKAPQSSAELKVEGELFFGIELTPDVSLLANCVKVGAPCLIGARVSAEYDIQEGNTEKKDEHFCDRCLDGEIKAVAEFSADIIIFGKTVAKKTMLKSEIKITDFYYSSELGFGLGICPNTGYTLKVYVVDENRNPIANADVCGNMTDEKGYTELKLPGGKVRVNITKDGYKSIYREFDLNKSQTLSFTMYKSDEENNKNPDIINGDSINLEDIPTEGRVEVNYYPNGTIVVSGNGPLNDNIKGTYDVEYTINYNPATRVRVYTTREQHPNNIIIGNGITSISKDLLRGYSDGLQHSSLTSVTIGNSVTGIGMHAFWGCPSLKSVKIPDSVTRIDWRAFGFYSVHTIDGDGRIIRDDRKVDGFTIYGCSGSEAERYANENGFKFVDISKTKSSTRAKAVKALKGSDNLELKTHTIKKSGLVPNADYVLLVLDGVAEGELSGDKLLYIAQAKADSEGKVEFEIYGDFGDSYWEGYVLGVCAHKSTHTETVNFPTETEDGLEITVCDICDKIIESRTLDKLPEETTKPEDETVPTSTEATQQSSQTDITQPTEPSSEAETTQPTQSTTPAAKISKTKVRLKAGKTVTLKVTGGTVKKWTSSNSKIATVKSGKVTALKKGAVTITATLKTGKKLTCKVTVTTSPKLSKKTVTVKKNKTVSVKITGKAKAVKNVYTNTKIAKITSKNTAATLKIKGLKKGSTTLKVKVNGVVLKLKVKVK